MKKVLVLIFVAVVAVSLAGTFIYNPPTNTPPASTSNQNQAQGNQSHQNQSQTSTPRQNQTVATTTPKISIMNVFGNKIVYTSDMSQNQALYKKDCQSRGGTFNSCGSVCAPDAEICAQVCAYTCQVNR